MIQRPARLLALLVSIFVTLASQAMTVDEVPNVHVASRTRYVSNPSGVLSPQAEARLNRAIADLWDKSSVELVVVAIDSIDPSMTPEEFATALFETKTTDCSCWWPAMTGKCRYAPATEWRARCPTS